MKETRKDEMVDSHIREYDKILSASAVKLSSKLFLKVKSKTVPLHAIKVLGGEEE
jgi:hypothetical protein